MPPNDQEPRYRLVDSNGNVVGSLFQNSAGNVEIQDETGTGSVFGPDGIVTPAIDAGSVSTESLNSSHLFAESFDGADQNARLDNAISAATDGESIIHMEPVGYDADRTISKELTFVGTAVSGAKRSAFLADNTIWQLDAASNIIRVGMGVGAELQLNDGGAICDKMHLNDATITVDSNRCVLNNIVGFSGSEVVFTADAADSIIDSSTTLTVTDNGSNTVGDIA